MRVNTKEYTQYISIYMMFMASAGYYLRCFSQTICYAVLLLALFILIMGNRKICIDGRILSVSLFLGVLGLISSFLATDSFEYTILPFLALIISALLMSNIDIHEFEKVYVNIILLISVVSIVAEIIFMIFPQVLSAFPIITNSSGVQGYNLLFSVVSFNYGSGYRIQGIFWEPGAFQFFISGALLILRKRGAEGHCKRYIAKYIILIIAMIMTFSTTAYIVLLLFALTVITNQKNNTMLLVCIIMSIIALAVLMFVPWVQEVFNNVLGDKLTDLINAFGGETDNASAQVRFDSIYYPSRLFFHNPILGVGYKGLLELKSIMGHGMTTCTPINYFATYGIVYGFSMLILFFQTARYFAIKKKEVILIFVLLLTTVISEDFNATVCLNSFLFLGIKMNGKNTTPANSRMIL